MSRTDPQGAFPWANSIQDLDKRTEAVANVVTAWHVKDPVAAKAALKASGLPADRIEQTLTKLQPPPPQSLPPR